MDDGVIRDREGEGGKPLTQIKRVGEGHQPSKKALWGKGERRKVGLFLATSAFYLTYVVLFSSTSPFLHSSPCVSCIMSCELRRNEGDNVKGTNKKVRKQISSPYQTSDRRGNDP